MPSLSAQMLDVFFLSGLHKKQTQESVKAYIIGYCIDNYFQDRKKKLLNSSPVVLLDIRFPAAKVVLHYPLKVGNLRSPHIRMV